MSQPAPAADEIVQTAPPSVIRGTTRRTRCCGAAKFDEHRVDVGEEGRPGHAGAVEQHVDSPVDGVDRCVDGFRVAEVDLVVAGDVDQRFPQVEHVDLDPEPVQLLHRRDAHAPAATAADHHTLAVVAKGNCPGQAPSAGR